MLTSERAPFMGPYVEDPTRAGGYQEEGRDPAATVPTSLNTPYSACRHPFIPS